MDYFLLFVMLTWRENLGQGGKDIFRYLAASLLSYVVVFNIKKINKTCYRGDKYQNCELYPCLICLFTCTMYLYDWVMCPYVSYVCLHVPCIFMIVCCVYMSHMFVYMYHVSL